MYTIPKGANFAPFSFRNILNFFVTFVQGNSFYKVIVDKSQFDAYEYTVISYETGLPEKFTGYYPCVIVNLKLIYNNSDSIDS